MAQQADGTVYINSSIDTDGFTAGGKEIEAAARRAAKTVKGIGDAARIALERQTAAFVKSNQLYAQQEQKVKDLEAQLEKMTGKEIDSTALNDVDNRITDIRNKLIDLLKQEEDFLKFGGKMDSEPYKQMENELSQLRSSLQLTKEEKDKLLAAGGQYTEGEISVVTEKLLNEQQKLRQIGDSLNISYDSLKNKIEEYGGSIAGAAQKHGLLRKALSSVAGAAKKAGVAMLLFHKNTKKSNGSIGTGIKNMLKYTLGISSLLVLFRKIKSAVKEGMQNLAQYSGETNAHLSALKSSMTQLKNSLATAFNPILTVITPILTRFIDLLSKAATYVGMFFAALTGQKSFTKAVAVQEDYAASLGKTAKNAKEAQKYLSGLDEIRTFTEDNDSSGGAESGVDPSQMFEEVSLPDFINDWVKKFKEAWENADFTDIGRLVGTKLRNALDSIPWEEIKENAKKLGGSLATLLNGFFSTPGLAESIGATIGELINTGVAFAKEFLSTFDFLGFGKEIAAALNSMIETIDWKELAETFSLGIEGLFDTAIGFLEELDWELLADSVWEFLENVDWGGILGRLGLLILELFRAEFSFGNQLGQDITSSLAEFFREIGWDSVSGFFEGLHEKIKEYGEKVKAGFQLVIDWAKEKLGIHSPSTVFAEIGRNIIQGLINGIQSLLQTVTAIWESIEQNAINTWNNTKNNLSTIWNNIKTAGTNFGTNLKNSIINSWNSIKTNTSTIWSGIKNTITNAYSSISNIIGNLANSFSGAIDKAKSAAANIISTFSNIHIPLPHFSIGSTSHSIAGVSFSLPSISVDWYAKGGLFDQPSVIGVGEAGQEAVLPLTNSKVMSLLASNIVAKMPTPYLASGAVVPPKAQSSSVQVSDSATKNMESMYDMMASVFEKLSQNQGFGGDINLTVQLDSTVVFRKVIDRAKLQQTVSGRNPFLLGT